MGQYFCQSIRKGIEHFWNFNKALEFVLILQKKILSIFSENNIVAVTFMKCKNIAPWPLVSIQSQQSSCAVAGGE